MKEKIYVFTITYNFDGSYVAKKCDTYEEAINMLNGYLKEEIKIVRDECEYEPSVLRWAKDDVTLVYEEGYTMENICCNNVEWDTRDCAYYRIFEVEI